MNGNTKGSRGLLSQNTSVHQNMISSTTPRFVAKTITRNGQIANQENKRELLDPTSEHSTAIWDQQGRPVEGIIVPKSGHATAYVERFVCVFLLRLGLFALRTGKKNTQVGVYPFQCKVYVHCIHCVYSHSGVDSKDKLYTLCTLC